MNKLHNCPNCGGYLNDNGRCEFCGSKVYDFVNVDFDDNTKTYIRVRYQGNIVLMPVVFSTCRYDIMRNPINTADIDKSAWKYIVPQIEIEGTLDFYVVGDVIAEGSEDEI